VAVSGTGQMMARFHWSGTVTIDVASDRLKRYDSGLLKTAAASLRNHAGTESNPVDVKLYYTIPYHAALMHSIAWQNDDNNYDKDKFS